VETTKQKEEKKKFLSPRNRKACHSVNTALLKSVAEIVRLGISHRRIVDSIIITR
jgi:hypothetical protein